MQLDFSGKVIIITGSSAGIGAAAARGFASGGGHVVINYAHNRDAGEAVAQDCRQAGGEACLVHADISTPEGRQALVDAALSHWGKIDVLVNNAGTTRFVDHSNLDGLSPDDFHDIYDMNLVAPYEMIKLTRPHLAENGGGAIINISSVAGVGAVGSSLAYIASKGGLNSMTMGLARALAPDGIRVNAVCPGFVGTDWFRNAFGDEGFERISNAQKARTPSGYVAGPDDICGPILFFAHPISHHVTGQHLVVDGGMLLGMPNKL